MSGGTGRRQAAVIGGGVIGGGWAARFLLAGWDVAVFDPDPDAPRKLGAVLDNARRALPGLYDRVLPPEGALRVAGSIAQAVTGADWVQESVPERLEVKHATLAEIETHLDGAAVIGSSTSGFRPSELQSGAADPARIVVAHPFNPVYLLPLVELVGDADTCARAADILRGIGMFPLHVRKEIDAHIADRLLEAVWREALWLVTDGIATTAEIDEAIRMGFGLRWAQMGLFETYRIAGGEAGMKHFMAQFGPALQWPWTRLMDVPEFTPDLVDLIAAQSDAQSGHMGIRDLERLRDDNLVAMLRALKRTGSGAGGVIAAHEAGLPAPAPGLHARTVPVTWTDDGGHMTEPHMLEVACGATAGFLDRIEAGSARSFFPARTTLHSHADVRAGDRLQVTTRVLEAAPHMLRLWHGMTRGDGTLAAEVDRDLTPVTPGTRQPCAMPEATLARLRAARADS